MTDSRASTIIENQRSMRFVTNARGVVSSMSSTLEELLGITFDPASRLTLEHVFTEPVSLNQLLPSLAKTEDGSNPYVEVIAFLNGADRAPCRTHWLVQPQRIASPEETSFVWIGVILPSLPNQNRQASGEAESIQSDKLNSLGVLARGVAHEINNPMTAILNYASIIAEEDSDEELREYAQDIEEEGRRVTNIVSNFLNYARTNSGMDEDIQVSQLLERVKMLVNQAMLKGGLKLEVQVADEKLWMHSNLQDIQHALFNVLLFSLQAFEPKETSMGTLERWIKLGAYSIDIQSSTSIRFKIEHNGSTPSDQMMGCFRDDGIQVSGAQEEHGDMGLYVAQAIVQNAGGQFQLKIGGEGTTIFEIDVPANLDKILI